MELLWDEFMRLNIDFRDHGNPMNVIVVPYRAGMGNQIALRDLTKYTSLSHHQINGQCLIGNKVNVSL